MSKELYMKNYNGEKIFSLEYDKETLRDMVLDKQEEIGRLNNIITELEKWLEENGEYIDDSDYAAIYVEDIMNKLKELKESDKE